MLLSWCGAPPAWRFCSDDLHEFLVPVLVYFTVIIVEPIWAYGTDFDVGLYYCSAIQSVIQ